MDGKPISEYFNELKIKDSEIELILQTVNTDVSKIMLLTIDDNGNTFLINKESK